MADAKISELPAAAALAAADLAPIVQGSGVAATTRRATFAQITAGVHAERMYHVRDYGAVGNGTTDDAAAIQAAIDAAAAGGGGIVRLGPRRYRVTGASIVVKENVCLEGPSIPGAQRALGDYRNIPGTILLSSSRTMQMLRASTMRAVTLLRDGAGAPPANVRAGIDIRAQMAGTAISIGTTGAGQHDVLLQDLLVLGFDLAIRCTSSQRMNVQRLRGDNRNGIYMTNSFDIARIHDVHFWPFLTANLSAVSRVSFPIGGVANNGSGAVRITTTSAHGLITGDIVNIYGIDGVPGGNGRFAVTVIDTTRVDLQGSTFTGSWIASGTLQVWNGRRFGTAFRIEDSDVAELINCFCYGYERGFDLGNGAQSIQLHNCSVDDQLELKDPNTIGALIQGSAFRTKWVGGFISSQATAIRVNSNASNQGDNQFVGVMVGGSGAGRAVEVFDGGLTLVACDLPNCRVYLASGGDNLSVVASDTRSATFEAQTPADLGRIALVGNRLQALGSSPDQERALLRRRTEALGAALDLENQDAEVAYSMSLGSGALAPLEIGGDATANPNGGIILGAASEMTQPMKLTLRRASTSGAAGSTLGQLAFSGKNAAGTQVEYARAGGISETVTSGAEGGAFVVETRSGGALAERFRISTSGTVTLTGPLLLPADPASDNQAARKGYVDAQFTARRLPVVATSGATALTLASHNGRVVAANAGTTLSISWASTGDGFSCLVVNRGSGDLAISMSGFTGTAPTNPDGLTKIRAGGMATLLAFSPDGGTTRLLMLAGATAL